MREAKLNGLEWAKKMNYGKEIMEKKFTLTEPQKYKDYERWIVYIIDENKLSTGVAGYGNIPREATWDAQLRIDQGKGVLPDIEK